MSAVMSWLCLIGIAAAVCAVWVVLLVWIFLRSVDEPAAFIDRIESEKGRES